MMKCLCVLLCVALSAVSLAATSAIPKRLSLRFTIGGKHAKVRLNLKELHNLAARGGEYERQAQLALENIKLLPSADNPLLMISILERIARSKAASFRDRKELRGSRRSPSYREQKELWQAIHDDSYSQDTIEKIYTNVYDALRFSNKLLKLLSPLAKLDYLNHIRDRTNAMHSIWGDRGETYSLLERYAVEAERMVDGSLRSASEEDVKNLVAKIMAEITAQDAARAEKIQLQVTTVARQFTYSANKEFSRAAYFQAMVAEMLHEKGLAGQEQEAQFQLLVSDFWVAQYRLRSSFASEK